MNFIFFLLFVFLTLAHLMLPPRFSGLLPYIFFTFFHIHLLESRLSNPRPRTPKKAVIIIEHIDQLEPVNYTSSAHHVLSMYRPFRVNLIMYTFKIACNRTLFELAKTNLASVWKQSCEASDTIGTYHRLLNKSNK